MAMNFIPTPFGPDYLWRRGFLHDARMGQHIIGKI
jgi:hypothetical protein